MSGRLDHVKSFQCFKSCGDTLSKVQFMLCLYLRVQSRLLDETTPASE